MIDYDPKNPVTSPIPLRESEEMPLRSLVLKYYPSTGWVCTAKGNSFTLLDANKIKRAIRLTTRVHLRAQRLHTNRKVSTHA